MAQALSFFPMVTLTWPHINDGTSRTMFIKRLWVRPPTRAASTLARPLTALVDSPQIQRGNETALEWTPTWNNHPHGTYSTAVNTS
jgi:hypothetical protein